MSAGDGIGLVILAAGRGSRFGPEPKLLALDRGHPLVRRAAETALAAALGAGLGPVVVVLGAHAGRVGAALDGLDLSRVENPDHAAGLSTSLRAGLAALPAACGAAIVMLADMPRVTVGHLDRLAAAYRAARPRPAAVVPVHDGRRGNPVLLDRRLLADDLARLGGDHGAGPLLRGRADVLEIAGDAGTGFDVDTPDALAHPRA